MVYFLRKIGVLSLLLSAFTTGYGQAFESSNLPLLLIDTQGQEIPNEPKIIATIKIIDNGAGKRNAITDKPTYSGKIGIEQRGSTSRILFPKKPYGFELRDTSGIEGLSESVLGLPKEEDWILNATYNDKTLMRDVLTYELYRTFSTTYTPRNKYCEVLINGNYEGIYILFEKIKRDKNRVNIAKIEPKDSSGDALTGGYILKVDKIEGSESRTWMSPYLPPNSPKFTIPIQVDHPKVEDITEPQFEYIKQYVTDFEKTLKSATFADSAQGYARYINVDSWVDYLIISEVCRNIDGYRLSTYLYKDRDSKGGKLTMGPIWDYNLAYGNADYCGGEKSQGWAFDFNRVCPNDGFQMPFWWDRLLEDRTFARKVRLRYQALRPMILNTQTIHRHIDSTATVLQEARIRNFARWPVIGQKIWPNFYVGTSYEDEVGYLKSWITRRLDWMDQELMTFGTEVTATEPAVAPFGFRVFPNPGPAEVQVSFRLERPSTVRVQVYDLWGRVMQESTASYLTPGDHIVPVRLTTSASSIQFLGLEVDGKRVAVKKVLRE